VMRFSCWGQGRLSYRGSNLYARDSLLKKNSPSATDGKFMMQVEID
jgi:hypothetical protein